MVLLTKVVVKTVLVPLTSHTARLRLLGALSNLPVDPVIVSVISELPGNALAGEIEILGLD